MSWLDDFLLAIKRVRNSAGENLPQRTALQFGPGFTLTDDPAMNAIIVGGGGGGGGATGPTGPTGPAGATGATGASGVASQLPSGWSELAGDIGFSPGPTLITSVSVTTETICHVWAAVSASWRTSLASSGAAFFVTLSNGINTYTSDETSSDATVADDDVSISINFRTPVPVAAGVWTARVYGRRTKSTSSLVCTHCDLTVLGFQGAQGPTGPAPSGSGVVLVETGVPYAGLIADAQVSPTAAIQGSKLQAASAVHAGAMSASDYRHIPASGDVDFPTPRVARVVGLQGVEVSTLAPSYGQLLGGTFAGIWEPVYLTGDITRGNGIGGGDQWELTVSGLQGRTLNSAAPDIGAFLTWDSVAQEWTPYAVFASSSDVTYTPGTSLRVTSLQGQPVSAGVPTANSYLRFDGTSWEPGNATYIASGDVSVTGTAATVTGLQGRALSASAPSSGASLVYDGSQWAPRAAIVSGDVSVTAAGASTLEAIQGVGVSASPPALSQTLVYTGTKWAPRDIIVTSDVAQAQDGTCVVQGLLGRPMDVGIPAPNDVLTWDGAYWAPAAPAGVITSGDVSVAAGVATVTGLQGDPVDVSALAAGRVLAYSGTQWQAVELGPDIGQIGGDPLDRYVVGLRGTPIASTAPTTGQVLAYTGSQWAPATLVQDTFSASIDLKVAGLTQIGTLRADKGRFFATEVWMHVDAVASLGVTGPSISVGWDGGTYAEWVSNAALPNSSLVVGYFSQVALRAAGTSRISAPAGSGVFVQVNTASNATTYTATIIVRGYYLTNP